MKGFGSRLERETIINFNDAEDTATVWTASAVVYRRLKKLGYMPVKDSKHSAKFEVPKRHIRLPKQPSKARQAQGRGTFARFAHARGRVQAPDRAGVGV